MSYEMILSYGFGRSTGQAQFKQKFNEPSASKNHDVYLLPTSIIPLRLISSSGRPRLCRSIKLEYIKETNEVFLKEEQDLRNEINALTNF